MNKMLLPCLLLLTLPGITKAQQSKMMNNQDKINQSQTLIIVVSDDWKDSTGVLYRFSRKDTTNAWQPSSESVAVVLGQNGMAPAEKAGIFVKSPALKKEGDRKSPAGIFTFGFAFGYADPMKALFTRMPYLMSNELIECIDDPASKYYNKIVSTDIIAHKDWNSSEKMLLKDSRYEWGIEVEYNKSPIVAGAGSCIFFHIWADDHRATAGCTAMEKENLISLMSMLNPSQNPVLIQMPVTNYRLLRKTDKTLPKIN